MAELHIDVEGTRTVLHQHDDAALAALLTRVNERFIRDGGAWFAITHSGHRHMTWFPRTSVLRAHFDNDEIGPQLRSLAVNLIG